jgi:hypothetical protein
LHGDAVKQYDKDRDIEELSVQILLSPPAKNGPAQR